MNRFNPLIFLTFIAFFVTSPVRAAWIFEQTTGRSLVFKDGDKTATLNTNVPSPDFIAVLTDPESDTPYVLYRGRTCKTCDEGNVSLFVQRIDGKGKAHSYVYPGRITDPRKGLVYQGRVFYGNCLPKVKVGLVAHQREAVDRHGMRKSVLIAEPGPQYVYEALLERRLPSVRTTLGFVKKKVCFEIAGRSRTVLKKPLNLTPTKGLDDNDEEDDTDRNGPAIDAPADAPTADKE
jgi:hypothetical protein